MPQSSACWRRTTSSPKRCTSPALRVLLPATKCGPARQISMASRRSSARDERLSRAPSERQFAKPANGRKRILNGGHRATVEVLSYWLLDTFPLLSTIGDRGNRGALMRFDQIDVRVLRVESIMRRNDMKARTLLLASVVAASPAVVTVEPATAQDMQGQMMPGMMQGGMGQQPNGQGMMQGMMPGRMGSEMMCPMMRSGMMQGGMMGSEMMGSGMMHGGMSPLFGSRVTPVMNLSIDDVRGYLASQLERLNNKRLKVGNINSGDGTVTADIVTVDNSLVQRLKVDRHSGAI